MLFKTVMRLNQEIPSAAFFNVKNLEASNKVSNKYLNKTRVMSSSINEKILVLLGYIDNKLLSEMSMEIPVHDYLSEVNLEGEIISIKEITATDFWQNVRVSEGYYDNDEENIQFDADIWLKYTPKIPRCNYEEHIVTSEDTKYEENTMYTAAMQNEITRIKSNKNKVFLGHPVHYLIKAHSNRTTRGIHNKLTALLVENHRLMSSKVVSLEFERPENPNFETGMALASGGSMLIDLIDQDLSRLGGHHLNALMTELVQFMHDNEHKVLFSIRYDNEEGRVINAFLEKAAGFTFVRIHPELMTYNQAVQMLTSEAQRYQLDPALFTGLIDKEQVLFTENEVMNLFSKQQAILLHDTFFPEYANITVHQVKALADSKGKAHKELMSLIGLTKVKELINKLIAQQKAYPVLAELGIAPQNFSRHMVFTGDPGTAKTTVARLYGKIMKDNGLLKSGHFIEAGRADLVAEYVGQTAVKVSEIFKRARGGVLFLDEIYSLVDDRRGSFGDEALATIVQLTENYRDELIVIFAGYSDKMKDFLNVNPGLASRINFNVHFDNYTVEELVEISKHIALNQGYKLSSSVQQHISILAKSSMNKPNFGNGRYIRNVVEEAIMNHVSELFGEGKEIPSKEDILTLEVSDFRELPLDVYDDSSFLSDKKNKAKKFS